MQQSFDYRVPGILIGLLGLMALPIPGLNILTLGICQVIGFRVAAFVNLLTNVKFSTKDFCGTENKKRRRERIHTLLCLKVGIF